MRCPMCLGKGYATDEDIKEYPHRCPNCNGKGFYSVDWQKFRCDVCKGSGKKPMTEQEYIQTCTTEQLADELADVCYGLLDDVWGNDGDTSCDYRETEKNYWVEWLKQPHTNE